MTSTETLLARLEAVKETGPGRWVAKCPAHEDRSPSLSIRELPDGKLLLHDFGGCSAVDVVQAVGLEMQDLFPDGGREYRPGRKHPPRVPAADLLLLADQEALVLAVLAAQFLDQRTLSESDWERLAKCTARLGRLADEVRR